MSPLQSYFIQPWLRLSTVLLLASVGLHGVVISLPLPESKPDVESSTPAENLATETIDVVSLPPNRQPAAPQLESLPAPEPLSAKPPAERSRPAPQSNPPVPIPEVKPQPAPPRSPELPSNPDSAFQPEPPAPVDPLEDPNSYVHNGKSSGSYNGNDEFSSWVEQVMGQFGFPSKLETPVIVPYPLPDCLMPVPLDGSVGIIVNPDGSITGEEILGSTGYDVLDQEALNLLDTVSLPAVDQPKAFTLPVVVQHDAASCTP